MKNYLNCTLIFVLQLMVLLPSSVYAKGVESGGGGGVVLVPHHAPVLMDYFTVIDSIADLPISTEVPSIANKASLLSFSIIKENEATIRKSNKAFDKAMGILESWSQMPYDVMSFEVLNAFTAPLVWNFTEQKLTAPPFYLPPGLPAEAEVAVAAYYAQVKNNVNVSISKTFWNQMSLNDQAGLLIHESLRQVQIGFKNGYDDEVLQRVTAIYLLCQPAGRLNYYMFYLLNNSSQSADFIYGDFKKIFTEECKERM
jgi:hypothetical protein